MLNVLIGLLRVSLSLMSVEAFRRLTDIATHSREGSILYTAIGLACIYIAEILVFNASAWVSAILGVRTLNEMQHRFFDHILHSQWRSTQSFHTGDIVNRLFSDVNDIVRFMTEVIPSLVIIIVQVIVSVVYLYSMNRVMAIIMIVCSPTFFILSRLYFRKMRKIVRRIKDSNSAIQSIIQEALHHRMVVKVLQQEDTLSDRLARRQQLLHRQTRARARFSIYTKTCVNGGFYTVQLLGFTWGITQLQDGVITVGVLIAFTQLVLRIQRPILEFIQLMPVFVNSATSCERLIELEDLTTEQPTEPHQFAAPVGIRFDNVTYSYQPDSNTQPTITDFTHDFQPGSFTALLGQTGSGKTTLIRMMLDLVTPQQGTCRLYSSDGTAIDVSPSTRTHFSYVPQGNTLFSGTIRDNLRLGNPSATTDEMYDALRTAKADFVFDLPRGLDTLCTEGGGGLSEGQAQRITIARALLRPCSILLLDEATSALDIETEEALLRNIQTKHSTTTVIFVTHRLAVAGFATESLTIGKA